MMVVWADFFLLFRYLCFDTCVLILVFTGFLSVRLFASWCSPAGANAVIFRRKRSTGSRILCLTRGPSDHQDRRRDVTDEAE
jgi:hypothetical protein